ncbi:uncharacterized protein LOC111830064 isoform X1 [Capsella rubella]|uniref:uncharacterized protein LOC111830064 isoform X1 n=1 Tax=Capsella rubella TaxID=81985 RepID=UPI000CD4AC29|nr:uncharacterized protein LOC111830064 isoform X1 [Capsella rubella]
MNVLVFEFRVQALSVQELIEELASPNNTSRTMAMNYAKPLYTTSTKRSQEPEQENQFVYRNGALRWSCVIFWFPKLSPSPKNVFPTSFNRSSTIWLVSLFTLYK